MAMISRKPLSISNRCTLARLAVAGSCKGNPVKVALVPNGRYCQSEVQEAQSLDADCKVGLKMMGNRCHNDVERNSPDMVVSNGYAR